jgi:DNA-binding CsgD family transcriptional regulator
MNKNQKQTRKIAYLRQLCCSGLDKEIVIPEFLRAVQQVLPSSSNTCCLVEKKFAPAEFFLDYGPIDIPGFHDIMLGYWIPNRIFDLGRWFAKHPIYTNPLILDEKFYKSDLYGSIFSKLGQHHMMNAPAHYMGVRVAMITLYRQPNCNPFDAHEQAIFLRLLPYVAHAMKASVSKDIQYCENGANGIMIMDHQGTVIYQSQVAKKLLDLACNPLMCSQAPLQKASLMAKLAQVCHSLNSIFLGEESATPSWCHVNGRGRFIFRAQWLDKLANEPGGLIGITIEHQEPQLIKILRAIQDTPLTPIQREVAVLLAQGATNEKIGKTLHIKLTTTKCHIRNIYNRLEIESRGQLLPELLKREKEKLIQMV